MIQRERLSVTIAGGSGSANTRDLRGQCGLIICVPTTQTTSYDVKLTDDQNLDVYEEKGLIGTVRNTTVFPIKGIYTVTLSNVSANEPIVIAIYGEESP